MSAPGTVIVGLSGGVDSAVAALLLREQGFDVQCLHMTNWDGDDAWCTAAADLQAARAVAQDLGLVLHEANFAAEYRRDVFRHFLDEYAAGRTPNPDILCNRTIKFGVMLDHARRLGAARIATGHYARGGAPREGGLFLARDQAKDQTYFLHAVEREALAQTLFPLGDLTKDEVRAIANRAGLASHDRPDSTGICFIGERPFRAFLRQYLRGEPGPVLSVEGELLGRHDGLPGYTIGQRSGVGVGGRRDGNSQPWYVAGKDIAANTLVVAQGRDHPALWSGSLRTAAGYWLRAPRPGERLTVRIRHRHGPVRCDWAMDRQGGLLIRFPEPQWAVASGQYAVLYSGDECLGGAVIEAAGQLMPVEAVTA